MILGRVVGEVWATKKHSALDGRKLLIIEPYLWYAPSHEVGHLVAVDAVGAGVGEDVVVCMGDPARRSLGSTSHAGRSRGLRHRRQARARRRSRRAPAHLRRRRGAGARGDA